jgi:hypothetical protein
LRSSRRDCSIRSLKFSNANAGAAASGTSHREAKLMLFITQIAIAATSPALANTADTTAALNKITPNAYAILLSAHRITPMKRPNTQ